MGGRSSGPTPFQAPWAPPGPKRLSQGDIEYYREMLETLNGSRARGNISRAAVRIEDLNELLRLVPKMKSVAAAGSTPTKAEYDALRADVAEIFKRLHTISLILQARIKP